MSIHPENGSPYLVGCEDIHIQENEMIIHRKEEKPSLNQQNQSIKISDSPLLPTQSEKNLDNELEQKTDNLKKQISESPLSPT